MTVESKTLTFNPSRSRIFNTWIKRINDEVTQAQAANLARTLEGHGRRTLMTSDEARDLLALIRTRQPPFDADSVTRGLRWLYNLAYTPTGRTRKTNPYSSAALTVLRGGMPWIYLYGLSQGRPEYLLDTMAGSFVYRVRYTKSDAMIGNRNEAGPVAIWNVEVSESE